MKSVENKTEPSFLLGPYTVIFSVDDLKKATEWYSAVLGFGPYFEEDYYVGFNVSGHELGLSPDGRPPEVSEFMSVAYWGVKDIDTELARITSLGATIRTGIADVGVKVASVIDPFGNVLGLIENPHFPSSAKPISTKRSLDGKSN